MRVSAGTILLPESSPTCVIRAGASASEQIDKGEANHGQWKDDQYEKSEQHFYAMHGKIAYENRFTGVIGVIEDGHSVSLLNIETIKIGRRPFLIAVDPVKHCQFPSSSPRSNTLG